MSDADAFFSEADAKTRAKILGETARIDWQALLPHFARGAVIAVDPALDLVDVAECLQRDDAAQLKAWMDAGQVGQVSDAQALQWLEQQTRVWAVVLAPWVLVQDRD